MKTEELKTEEPATPPASTPRLFRVLALLLVLVAAEVGSFLLLSTAEGEWRTWGRLHLARLDRLHTDVVGEAEEGEGERLRRRQRIATVPTLHPFAGYVRDPTTDRAAGDDRYSDQAAEFGFPRSRHDLFQEERPSEEVRVAILGGSFAAGFALRASADDNPAGLELQRLERWRDKDVQVVNLALAGYKQPQQLTVLAYFLALGVHFDAVVNIDGFNEVTLPAAVNVPKGYFPFYPRGWDLMVGDLDQDQRRLMGELTYLQERRAGLARSFDAAPWRYSFTANLLWTILDRVATGRVTRAEQALTTDAEREKRYQARGPERVYENDDAMYDDLVAVWKRSSLQMHALCRQQGIDYIHVLQPNQYLPGSKPMGAEERAVAWVDHHPYRIPVEQAYPRLIAAGRELREAGVDFFDMTGVYKDVEEPIYKDACCHPVLEGYRLLAAALVDDLNSRPDPPE